MRQIRLISVGRTKAQYLKEGIEIYRKRLDKYCKFESIEVKESTYKEPNAAKQDEATRIQTKLDPNAFLILLDETGASFTSIQLAQQFESLALKGYSKFEFVIGGPWGLAAPLKSRGDLLLSLSKMTFTHQLIRLFLLEQVYRAFTIINHEKYHNP